MNRILLLFLTTCVFAICAANSVVAQSRTACRREVLQDQANHFLSALESRKPSSLPLAQDAKFTENGREYAVGEGLWKTAGKILMKRTVVDTEKCGTHTQAVIEENGRPIIYGVRLKFNRVIPSKTPSRETGGGDVSALHLSEIESFVARDDDFLFNAKGLLDTKAQDWEGFIPMEERSSRLGMIALARIFHRVSTAASQSGMSTSLRLFGLLDILSYMPSSPSLRAPCSHARLRRTSGRNPMKYPG